MIQKLILYVLGTFFSFAVQAQCDLCSSESGESIAFCYSDQEMPDRCAQFSNDGNTFRYANPSRKKNPVLNLPLPESTGPAPISYLTDLHSDKKYKLSGDDLIFVERALRRRAHVLAVKNWNISQINQGFTLTSSGLAYKILEQGTGPKPEIGKSVSVHYTGYFKEGKKFDSSVDRGKVFQFALGKGQVIKGWDEGVALMNVGSRYLFRIPTELAYGERGYPGAIPPNAVLYFDVQLIAAP